MKYVIQASPVKVPYKAMTCCIRTKCQGVPPKNPLNSHKSYRHENHMDSTYSVLVSRQTAVEHGQSRWCHDEHKSRGSKHPSVVSRVYFARNKITLFIK